MPSTAGRILTEMQRALTAPEPLDALEALTRLRVALDVYEREQVRRALDQGVSFAAIAREIGITRQAAHRRYRALADAPPAYTPELLRALQLARAEAARVGAEHVEVEHVARVLAGRALAPAGAGGPNHLGPRLRGLLRELERPIDVEDVRRAIQAAPVG
jgi:transposase-like protein